MTVFVQIMSILRKMLFQFFTQEGENSKTNGRMEEDGRSNALKLKITGIGLDYQEVQNFGTLLQSGCI